MYYRFSVILVLRVRWKWSALSVLVLLLLLSFFSTDHCGLKYIVVAFVVVVTGTSFLFLLWCDETQCHYWKHSSVLIYLRFCRKRTHNTCEINRSQCVCVRAGNAYVFQRRRRQWCRMCQPIYCRSLHQHNLLYSKGK